MKKKDRNCQDCAHCKQDSAGWEMKVLSGGTQPVKVGKMVCEQGWWDDHKGLPKKIRFIPGRRSISWYLMIKARTCPDFDPMDLEV